MCPHLPRACGDSGDIWTCHSWDKGTQWDGSSGALRDWEISQLSQIPAVPWLFPAGSAIGNPKSSKCIPSTSLSPSFSSGIYLYCSLNHITPPHPSWSAGHGHSLSHALGVGIGSRQLPGAQGSCQEGMRSHPGAGCDSLNPPQEARAAAERAVCPQSHSWADIWPVYVLHVPHICPMHICLTCVLNMCYICPIYV